MPPHLLRCQGIAVGNYSFTLGRLEAGAPSTFAHSGFNTSSEDILNFLAAYFSGWRVDHLQGHLLAQNGWILRALIKTLKNGHLDP
jgi:hypothetical protein